MIEKLTIANVVTGYGMQFVRRVYYKQEVDDS
jgi:hypothetical protein